MNSEVLTEAIGNISDRFIDEYSNFAGVARRHLSIKKFFLAAACLGVALSVVIASFLWQNTKKTETPWCSLSDVEGVVLENTFVSRFGHFALVTDDCWESPISEKELRKLLGKEGVEFLADETISTYYTVLRKGDGSVHTVRLMYQFENRNITVILDPSNAHFFQNDDAVVSFNGHELVVIRTMSEIDVVVKKGQSGIWIIGNKEEEKLIEKVLNFLLNTELDFDSLNRKKK